jgi:hypothetical protein
MSAIVLAVMEIVHIGSNEHDFLDHYVTRHIAKRQPSISRLCLLPVILFRSTILLVGPERHAHSGGGSQAITKYRSAVMGAQRVHDFTNAPSPEVPATWLDSVKGQPSIPSPHRLPGVLPPSTILTARPRASRALGGWF